MNRLPDIVFIDFEASSLDKKSYPIEVGWAFSTGGEESYLIRPAPEWTDWSAEAEATHHITREKLTAEGTPHDEVAKRMLEVLSGHALFATAPSWDGQWLSKLLRGSGLPRHALRLQDTDVAHESAIKSILQRAHMPESELAERTKIILADARLKDDEEGDPAHRALADAKRELRLWRDVQNRAEEYVRGLRP